MDADRQIVYPVYHVFHALAPGPEPWMAHAPVSNGPDAVAGIALTGGVRRRVLVANLTDRERTLRLPASVPAVRVLRLDAATADLAMRHPGDWRSAARVERWPEAIAPHAVLQLDWEEER
jgi:hypothetical protein